MDFEDPQKNSLVQRSWIYGNDSTMRRVEEKLNQTISKLGGKANNKTIINTMTRSRMHNNKLGDMHNSLPLEGKIKILKN